MKETIKNDKTLSRDVEATANKYRQFFIERLLKHSEIKKSSKTITVGGDKIPCTVITASIDEDGIAELTQDIVDYANNDKNLEKLVRRVAANAAYMEDPDDDDFEPLIDGLNKTFGNVQEDKPESNIVNLFTDERNRLQ